MFCSGRVSVCFLNPFVVLEFYIGGVMFVVVLRFFLSMWLSGGIFCAIAKLRNIVSLERVSRLAFFASGDKLRATVSSGAVDSASNGASRPLPATRYHLWPSLALGAFFVVFNIFTDMCILKEIREERPGYILANRCLSVLFR